MSFAPVVVSLPIADRRTSSAFYSQVLALEPFGAPASDGVPEPLQFALNDGLHLMLVPSGGFGWVIGERTVAGHEQSECVISVRGDVDALIERARAAGAEIVAEPAQQPWGYTATFADPDGHLWMIEGA